MREFRLFKCQFTSWEKICQITTDEVDYLLSILRNEGYAAMDHWMPTDPADKDDARKFLDYLESTLDYEISPCVKVYELECINKRADESIDALVDWIWQLVYYVIIGDGSDVAVDFKVQHRLICAIPDGDIELCKEILKVGHDKGVSHLLEIYHTYCAIESGAAVVCAGKTINAVKKSCQPQKQPSQCQNCTSQHPPGHDNWPAWESVCKVFLKGHWQAKCHSIKNSQSTAPVDHQLTSTHGQCGRKGKKGALIGVHTEEPLCDEIFMYDVCAPHTNEAYMTACLPTSASMKGMASLQVKVDTGASRNVLPLHLFKCLYPNCIDKTGHWPGFNVSNTKLIAYSGNQIPLFGSLHGPITWQPGSPGAQPHQINSSWYVADTPGPAILGLPSCERLEVKMNCAIKVIQDTS